MFPRLEQRHGLENLVERPITARQHDKTHRILDQHGLPHEEIVKRQRTIQKSIRPLLVRQRNVAADGGAAGLACAAARGFHAARAAARDDGETPPCELLAELARERIVAMAFAEPRGAEHAYGWSDVMQRAATPYELVKHPNGAVEIREQIVASAE